MQPESTESSSESSVDTHVQNLHNDSQYGLHRLSDPSTPSVSRSGDHGGYAGSSSEWSISPSPSLDSPASQTSWLTPYDRLESELGHIQHLDHPLLRQDEFEQENLTGSLKASKVSKGSALLDFPEEILFHVLSHLPPADLLNTKLVSRRFNNLVSSPHAWMNAFSRFFPGAEALKATADAHCTEDERSQKRSFARITPSASWSGEYLARTRLLRCLARGRPSLPFAAPCPGKPGRGSATFTFSSRLRGCSNLHADFGHVLDKRKPQFIHGFDRTGSVTSSDKRGKFDSWGFVDRVAFRQFSEVYPGYAPWGLGTSDIVGLPNVMDVSQNYGMVYGEALPGGNVFYLGPDEKRGQFLAPFLSLSDPEAGIPCVRHEDQSTCAVWVAKSSAVHCLTKGLIGILTGSSSGVVTAYSIGSRGNREPRVGHGVLTARWLLSPGVPITALIADDNLSEERLEQKRIWAVALNALGEIFYLADVPSRDRMNQSDQDEPERQQEIRAWMTGHSAPWQLIAESTRVERYGGTGFSPGDYLPQSVLQPSVLGQLRPSLKGFNAEAFIKKSPVEIRAEFKGWDMQRTLHADFAACDGNGAGETFVVIDCGGDENQSASLKRYMRLTSSANNNSGAGTTKDRDSRMTPFGQKAASQPQSLSFAAQDTQSPARNGNITSRSDCANSAKWSPSKFSFVGYKAIRVTASTLDTSIHALSTLDEDMRGRLQRSTRAPNASLVQAPIASTSPLRAPGQRARMLAVGTAVGTIFLWDVRTSTSSSGSFVPSVRPVRIIHTDSPGITSLAMTGLYLVHGGAEGLVQAWDPLASTLQPVRTLSSRHAINNRRRAVIAAQQQQQQNPAQPPILHRGLVGRNVIDSLAVGAICLDPDPTVLRGIVAIGGFLKYWSYSSASDQDLSRSQKRRLKKTRGAGSNNLGSSPSYREDLSSGRRGSLKGFVTSELAAREVDEAEKRKDLKEDERIANRFGLQLLGEGASEEEMIAYAKMLSEEQHEQDQSWKVAGDLPMDAVDPRVLEAQTNTLSDADAEKWKYAGWQTRFEMSSVKPVEGDVSHSATSTATNHEFDDDLAKAMELSLSTGSPSSSHLHNKPTATAELSNTYYDADVAEAMALSLSEQISSPSRSFSGAPTFSEKHANLAKVRATDDAQDDDIARAIQLSLVEQQQSRSSPSQDNDEFPSLASSSPIGDRSLGKGKGKRYN